MFSRTNVVETRTEFCPAASKLGAETTTRFSFPFASLANASATYSPKAPARDACPRNFGAPAPASPPRPDSRTRHLVLQQRQPCRPETRPLGEDAGVRCRRRPRCLHEALLSHLGALNVRGCESHGGQVRPGRGVARGRGRGYSVSSETSSRTHATRAFDSRGIVTSLGTGFRALSPWIEGLARQLVRRPEAGSRGRARRRTPRPALQPGRRSTASRSASSADLPHAGAASSAPTCWSRSRVVLRAPSQLDLAFGSAFFPFALTVRATSQRRPSSSTSCTGVESRRPACGRRREVVR